MQLKKLSLIGGILIMLIIMFKTVISESQTTEFVYPTTCTGTNWGSVTLANVSDDLNTNMTAAKNNRITCTGYDFGLTGNIEVHGIILEVEGVYSTANDLTLCSAGSIEQNWTIRTYVSNNSGSSYSTHKEDELLCDKPGNPDQLVNFSDYKDTWGKTFTIDGVNTTSFWTKITRFRESASLKESVDAISVSLNYTQLDTCTYSSENWIIEASDNCTITENVEIDTGYNITIQMNEGTAGYLLLDGANITGYTARHIRNASKDYTIKTINNGAWRRK